ncbi:hypothetical protein [Aureimonas glaciei]|uniref:hypothetical protein n=1 Tax=Aureimonas glaciei TaxID=1776957 RepID=UPI00166D30C3|nr:hypothetical protein [Aureimonas glaciei]
MSGRPWISDEEARLISLTGDGLLIGDIAKISTARRMRRSCIARKWELRRMVAGRRKRPSECGNWRPPA